MAYTIKGDVKTTGTMIIQGKQPGLNVTLTGDGNTYIPDTTGTINLPMKLKDEVDHVFGQLPFSQYGAINNNEPGVAGTFDGGSTVAYYSAMPVLLENDGSLVYLRPGTNGSTVNYYYTYVNNPDSNMKPYTTIKKYYEGSWNNILFADSDASNCLIYEEVGNNVVHAVLTNGTLDKASHTTASFARTSISGYIMSATVANSYMYIFSLYASTMSTSTPTSVSYSNSDPFQLLVYRIAVSDINSGSISTVERVSGITGNTMYGAQGSQQYIRIADLWASTSSTANAFIRYDSSFSSCAPYTYSIPGIVKTYFDGTNININISTNMYCTNSLNRYNSMYSFVVKYNESTKVFTTDLTTSSPLVCTGTSTTAITISNPYSITSANMFGVGTGNSDSLHGCVYITNKGKQFYIREKYVLSDFYPVYSGMINSFTTKAAAYNFRGRTFDSTSILSNNIYSDYASRVGDQLMGGTPISSSRIYFSGTGTYQGTNYLKFTKGVADIGTTRTYSYNSFTNGTITGYAPQAFRVPLGDDTYSGVSYCDASGNVSFYGTQFIENNLLSAGYKLDPSTLTYDKTITITNSVLTTLKSAILSNLGLSPASSLISLTYSPDTSYFNSIACISTKTSSSTNGGNLIVASVNVTLTGNAITAATLNTVISNFTESTINGFGTVGTISSEMRRHCSMCVVKYSDFTYVSFPHSININVPGDSQEYTYCGVKSGSTLTSLITSRSYHAPDLYTTARDYSYIPNYGFGFYQFTKTDKGTKLMFTRCGNTLSDFNNNMSAGTGTSTVVLAQDVIQGFYLYFTEVTPVLMNGMFYEMPITTIDLSTVKANPGNSTFYVYVDCSSGTPEYVVSTTTITESNTNMYIGYIETDGTKVSSLNISKVSRFGIYRPSETQIGTAFPVSTGNPAQTGTINW